MTRARWAEDVVDPETREKLAASLSGTALQSLLLDVMHRRAEARAPRDVLAQYLRDGFVVPSPVDLREMAVVDAHFLDAASAFDAIELSPVTPLGTCSTVAATHQHRVLSALRAAEVVSDPTNVLALECARRLRGADVAHLATSQRVLRAQPVPKVPGFSQHFRIFVLASGGVETRDHGFTRGAIALHLRAMIAALDRLERVGYAFGRRTITLFSTPERARVADRVAEEFGAERAALDHAYYSGGIRFRIGVTARDGSETPLVDGGTFDWLTKLTSNRRAAFVATGAGAQLVPLRFRRDARET
ncbi:MAG: hypothetical protein U0414_16015 [Polyangiaceae bacterium]